MGNHRFHSAGQGIGAVVLGVVVSALVAAGLVAFIVAFGLYDPGRLEEVLPEAVLLLIPPGIMLVIAAGLGLATRRRQRTLRWFVYGYAFGSAVASSLYAWALFALEAVPR